MICPTIGDGDCLFHAVLTEQEDVTRRAVEIRDNLWEIISENEEYKSVVKQELLDKYRFENREKPIHIKQMFDANGLYYELRKLGDIFPEDSPFRAAQGNLESDPIEPFNDKSILMHIKDYLADYRSENVSLSKAYIEVHSGEDGNSRSLADLIAKHLKIKVHVFRFDTERNQMNYLGFIGEEDSKTVRYVLQHGQHYWALYHDSLPGLEIRRPKNLNLLKILFDNFLDCGLNHLGTSSTYTCFFCKFRPFTYR